MVNSISSRLSGNVLGDLDKYEQKIKSQVLFSGAAAMALVIYDEVKVNVASGDPGRVTGNLEKSIYRVFAKNKSSPDQKTYQISWNRTTAPHGHLVEFGTSRAPAHPFLRPALSSMGKAILQGKVAMKNRLATGR